MPWRRVDDKFRRTGTIAGIGILVFAVALKFLQPMISDTLLLALVAAGAGLIHPSWVVDTLRKRREDRHGPH